MSRSPTASAHHKRVLLFGSFGPSLEVFRGALISQIVATGSELHAVADQIDDRTAAKLEARGARVHSVTLSRTSMAPHRFFAPMARLWQLFRRVKPDVVIAYTIKPVVLGALVNRNARFVAVITGLGYAFTEGTGSRRRLAKTIARILYRWALTRADVVLFQNPDDLADFRSAGALPPDAEVGILAGSGVELDHFCPAPLPAGAHFLMASRLMGDKGIREFAFAAAEVRSAWPDAEITLAGFFDSSPDSIAKNELETMIEQGVRYVGHLDDVRPAIRACGIYVLPSYREGTPRSVLEAMAMGRAIITTDAPGCRQTVVHGRNGLLVPPRDGPALAKAMIELAMDPDRVARMGVESRRIAEERFDVRLVNDALMGHAGLR